MKTRELVLAALAVFFAGYTAFTTYLIIEISNQNKAQQRALICFNEDGSVNHGEAQFTECRLVGIRELKGKL